MPMSAEERLDLKLALVNGRKCDQYDYLIAAFCGVGAGLVDSFFVGAPMESRLGKSVDLAADELVKKAAGLFWRADQRAVRPRSCPESLTQCISYLEQAFPVEYDARYAKDLLVDGDVLPAMSPRNHHLLSLSHSPDVIGLVFSIITQFTGKAAFMDCGRLIQVYPARSSRSVPYLQGGDLFSMLFCGFVNWLGHLISDLVGSSSTRQPGKTGRGAGIPMPLYELFLLCDFGDFDGRTFADLATSAFEQGYDLRHGAAMAIPVLLDDLMVRLLWALKRHFYDHAPWSECVPTDRHGDLRWMLLVSNASLCLVDGVDAAIRSGGDLLRFILHLNLVAWFKLVLMAFKELMLRSGFTYEDLKLQLQRINAALDEYLARLKSIDYAGYERELREIRAINGMLADENAGTEQIYQYFSNQGIELQFHSFEEFDRKMQEDDFVLEI